MKCRFFWRFFVRFCQTQNLKLSENRIKVGIITGSGFSDSKISVDFNERNVETPYGRPSDVLLEGVISDVPCVVLLRHGKQHTICPSNVNYRANIWALKHVGCTHILAQTSCGSLQKEIQPGQFLIIDQFFDRTNQRCQTFYDGKEGSPKGVLHVPMDRPFCEKTRQILIAATEKVTGEVHKQGTVVTIEGNRFSSKFESKYYHNLGLSVINMTTVPEVVLAKELGICYAALALVTDFDSWKGSAIDCVDAKSVKDTAKTKTMHGVDIIVEAVTMMAKEQWADVFKEHEDLLSASKM